MIYTITFDKALKNFILQTFGKTVNREGYIVDIKNPEEKVLAQDGEEVSIEEFAGIKKGSEVYIKSDIISIMRLCDNLTSQG